MELSYINLDVNMSFEERCAIVVMMIDRGFHFTNEEERCAMAKMIIDKGWSFISSPGWQMHPFIRNDDEFLRFIKRDYYDNHVNLQIILEILLLYFPMCLDYVSSREYYPLIVNRIGTSIIKPHTLNKFFKTVVDNGLLSIDDIEIFINAGLNPHNNEFFIDSCCCCSDDVVLYFINNCAADVNAENGKALHNVLYYAYFCRKDRENLIKILLDSGAVVYDDHIRDALRWSLWLPLIKYGNVTFDRVGEMYMKNLYGQLRCHTHDLRDQYLTDLKILLDSGVDFNQIMANLKIEEEDKEDKDYNG